MASNPPRPGDKYNGPDGIVQVVSQDGETVTVVGVEGGHTQEVPLDEFCRTYGDDPVRTML